MVSLVVSNLVEKVNQTPVIFDTDEVNLNLKVIAMVNIYFSFSFFKKKFQPQLAGKIDKYNVNCTFDRNKKQPCNIFPKQTTFLDLGSTM